MFDDFIYRNSDMDLEEPIYGKKCIELITKYLCFSFKAHYHGNQNSKEISFITVSKEPN